MDRAWNQAVLVLTLAFLSITQAEGHPLHLTTITVDLDAAATRVTAVAHVSHVTGTRPENSIPDRLRLRLDGISFRPSQASVNIDESGHTIMWQGQEPRAASVVSVDSPLFPGDPTVVVVYRGGRFVDKAILTPESPNAIMAESTFAFLRRFTAMGIRHIASGLDHVLFVIGLVLVRGTLRGLLSVITAFTLAHSITLSMTALEISSLPPWLVEPLIAVSIVAVGVENLVCRSLNLERRMWLAFGFGFFHGFGFAGALVESGLPRDSIGWSLAAFNFGVEIGQACIVLAAVPFLRLLDQRMPVLAAAATRCASVAIVAAGVVWLVQRLPK